MAFSIFSWASDFFSNILPNKAIRYTDGQKFFRNTDQNRVNVLRDILSFKNETELLEQKYGDESGSGYPAGAGFTEFISYLDSKFCGQDSDKATYLWTLTLSITGHSGNSGIERTLTDQNIISNKGWNDFNVTVGGEIDFVGADVPASNRYELTIRDTQSTSVYWRVYFNYNSTDNYKVTSITGVDNSGTTFSCSSFYFDIVTSILTEYSDGLPSTTQLSNQASLLEDVSALESNLTPYV